MKSYPCLTDSSVFENLFNVQTSSKPVRQLKVQRVKKGQEKNKIKN
jgi:hypothetical protein